MAPPFGFLYGAALGLLATAPVRFIAWYKSRLEEHRRLKSAMAVEQATAAAVKALSTSHDAVERS